MVEIEHSNQTHAVSSTGKAGAEVKNGTTGGAGIDMELVRELRHRLKGFVESEKNREEKLSMAHYEELMDPSSPFTAWRYLDHYGGHVDEAMDQAKLTLAWRKENQIDEPSNPDLAKEIWHCSPITQSGVSKDGTEVFYVVGRNYRKPDAKLRPIVRKFVQNLLFTWDREHRHSLDKIDIVFDVTDSGFRNIDLDFVAWLISIRDHVPARVNRIFVVGIPFIVRPLIRLAISWLPEKFRRILYCGTFSQLVEANYEWDNLPIEVGGTQDESYHLAPLDAPWCKDSEFFGNPSMMKIVEDCIGFWMDSERKAKLRQLQLEHEQKSQAIKH